MVSSKLDKCPTPGPMIIAKNNDTREAVFFRPPCKRWTCEHCQQVNAAQWAFVAWAGTHELQQNGLDVVFVTITSHERLGIDGALRVWPDAWKKLRQRIVYTYGKPEYYMVSEKHKTGKLHMHAVVSTAIEQSWLKTAARKCGLGYIAHVRPVDQAIGAAFYATKYLTKFGAQWPTGWRRVRLSQGWPRGAIDGVHAPEVEHVVVSTVPTQWVIDSMVINYQSIGYHVTVSKSCVAEPDMIQ
jgi:hypothetical protein